MEKNSKVVIIGGGVVGCSILFHLAKYGWKDVVLLERSELTSGSSWHAAGQIHTISSDPNISRLQGYTIQLYKEIEEISGQSVGSHPTGGVYLASTKDWYDYLKRERSKARYLGLEQEFIGLDELKRRHPLIDSSRYIAALWDPLDGDIDPSGVTYAYAKAAKSLGAKYYTHTPVIETKQRNDGTWDVVTPAGTINAEIVVNAAGLWAREVGLLAGIHLPLQPMEHHYLITEEISEIAQRGSERLPSGIDYEGNLYFRQEAKGMLLGTYEPVATPWSVAGTPQEFGHELLEPKLDKIIDRLALGFERIPALGKAGIKNIINGPFTFSPDGNPMIGPVPGLRNYWVAVGVMAGFCQGGGVGLCLAEWMISGESNADVWAMDVARFGEFATPQWGTVKASENYERRFVMTFPNETLPKGRRQRTTALYDRLTQMGAVWGQSFGLEHVLWFADNQADAFEEPTFSRSRADKYIAAEVKAVREAVGAIEIANFAKHEIKGAQAREFLDYVLAGRLPGPGRIALSPMLTPSGKLYGDFTVACLNDQHFMLFGSGVMQNAHRRWFENHVGSYNVNYANRSENLHGIAVAGPNARKLLSKLVREDVSEKSLRFLDIRQTFVAGVPAILGRISFSGELGFEMYVAPDYQLRLFEAVSEAGVDLGLKWYGARALMSLRLEKSWGVWALDYRPDYSLHESGLDPFVSWNKDFVGKSAAVLERTTGPSRKLVTLVIEDTDMDVSGDEAIISDGRAVGWVTSGGYAHHVGKSVAFGYVPTEYANKGRPLQVEIGGKLRGAEVFASPLYDPTGQKMRQ